MNSYLFALQIAFSFFRVKGGSFYVRTNAWKDKKEENASGDENDTTRGCISDSDTEDEGATTTFLTTSPDDQDGDGDEPVNTAILFPEDEMRAKTNIQPSGKRFNPYAFCCNPCVTKQSRNVNHGLFFDVVVSVRPAISHIPLQLVTQFPTGLVESRANNPLHPLIIWRVRRGVTERAINPKV